MQVLNLLKSEKKHLQNTNSKLNLNKNCPLVRRLVLLLGS